MADWTAHQAQDAFEAWHDMLGGDLEGAKQIKRRLRAWKLTLNELDRANRDIFIVLRALVGELTMHPEVTELFYRTPANWSQPMDAHAAVELLPVMTGVIDVLQDEGVVVPGALGDATEPVYAMLARDLSFRVFLPDASWPHFETLTPERWAQIADLVIDNPRLEAGWVKEATNYLQVAGAYLTQTSIIVEAVAQVDSSIETLDLMQTSKFIHAMWAWS